MSTGKQRAKYRERERMRRRLRAIGAPCPICLEPIDYDLEWWVDPKDGRRKRHPLSFEWDHDRPHSQGGSDGFENAQALHRRCNQFKGAMTTEQARAKWTAMHGGQQERAEPEQRPLVTSRPW